MDTKGVLCSLEVEPRSDVGKLAAEIRAALGPEHQVIESESAAFAGAGTAEIILVLGSSGAVAAAARILVAWVNARKERLIKINKSEFRGYSVEDALRLIQAMPGSGESRKKDAETG